MTQVYDILDLLKDELTSDPNVSRVTFGNFREVDISKTSLFPLSHFWLGGASMSGRTIRFTINLMCLDIPDKNNDYVNSFYGNTNLHDIFNTQLQVINRLIEKLRDRRGGLAEAQYVLTGEPEAEILYQEFENELAGWGVEFTIEVPNQISVC